MPVFEYKGLNEALRARKGSATMYLEMLRVSPYS